MSLLLIALLVFLALYYYNRYIKKKKEPESPQPPVADPSPAASAAARRNPVAGKDDEDPTVDGGTPLRVTQKTYDRLKREKSEKERKELEERKQRCADFWDKDVWKDDDCYLFFEGDSPVLISHGKRYTFGHDGREPMTVIYGDGIKYLHNGFDVAAECRALLNNPQQKVRSITGREHDAEHFCHLLFAAATYGGESCGIGEAESRLDKMEEQRQRAASRKENRPYQDERRDEKPNPNTNTQSPAKRPQPPVAPTLKCRLAQFPYPAKTPGGCRFPGTNDNSNFQEYGEVEVKMPEAHFYRWWFFYEDPQKPCMSHLGLDRQNHCILERRYTHGDLSHWTVEKRYFLISRNVMASCLALALIEGAMERNDYKELIAKLDRLVPPTGDPAKDGCAPLLPPQELLDQPSESERKAMEEEQERKELDGKVVWKDNSRKLYFEENNPILTYHGERYTFGCQPYEPMAIILHKGEAVCHIHNAFYPDECAGFIKNPKYLVSTITGHHHNAERFCRLLTTAIDGHYDCQMDEVEEDMQRNLVAEKGTSYIQFETRDFVCDKVLYEGVNVLLGHFETPLGKRYNVGPIYSVAFGYPNRNTDQNEYYLLSKEEYDSLMLRPEKQQWKNNDEPFAWQQDHLEGKHQVLCNEFRQNPAIFKPCFTLGEILASNKKRLSIHYSRVSVCAADDYVNRGLDILLPNDATVGDLVGYLQHYREDDGYSAIPYTGGGNWWNLVSDKGILAQVNDDGEGIRYQLSPSTSLKTLGVTKVEGRRG